MQFLKNIAILAFAAVATALPQTEAGGSNGGGNQACGANQTLACCNAAAGLLSGLSCITVPVIAGAVGQNCAFANADAYCCSGEAQQGLIAFNTCAPLVQV